MWICEFCEYESIFGSPPEALIRQYEIKDRRERKRLAEKRRLLEKAKLKGRKGKKGNKNATKTTTTTASSNSQAGPIDHIQMPDPGSLQSHGTQSDEYFDDGVEYEPAMMPAAPVQMPTKIPQPTTQNFNQNLRSATPSRGLAAAAGGGFRTE